MRFIILLIINSLGKKVNGSFSEILNIFYCLKIPPIDVNKTKKKLVYEF